jgi:hypothetical protein
MGQHQVLDGPRFRMRSSRRRFRIADLLVGVAMTAIGLSAIGLPDLTGRERSFLGLFATAFLAMLWAQWAVASMPRTVARPALDLVVGLLSALMALSMFVCLILVALVFPQAAALLSIMMLLQVVYLTTWE